jgi:hypothetical protein
VRIFAVSGRFRAITFAITTRRIIAQLCTEMHCFARQLLGV